MFDGLHDFDDPRVSGAVAAGVDFSCAVLRRRAVNIAGHSLGVKTPDALPALYRVGKKCRLP